MLRRARENARRFDGTIKPVAETQQQPEEAVGYFFLSSFSFSFFLHRLPGVFSLPCVAVREHLIPKVGMYLVGVSEGHAQPYLTRNLDESF